MKDATEGWMIGIGIGTILGSVLFHSDIRFGVLWIVGNLGIMYILLGLRYETN